MVLDIMGMKCIGIIGDMNSEGICLSDHSYSGNLDIELSFSSYQGKMLWCANYGNP